MDTLSKFYSQAVNIKSFLYEKRVHVLSEERRSDEKGVGSEIWRCFT